MKKSLLALAVLGAFATAAQAQSTNVSIGGVISANVKGYKVTDVNTAAGAGGSAARRAAADTEVRIDDDLNSRFWITGTEDLGGGLSALFYMENRLNSDTQTAAATGNGLGNGDTFVGLKGGFGQVTLGKHSMMSVQGLTTEIIGGNGSPVSLPTSMMSTFSIMNQFGSTALAGTPTTSTYTGYMDITRRQNSLMYRSPNIAGFNFSAGYSANSSGNEGTLTAPAFARNYELGNELYLQAGYANGPLNVSLAARENRAEGRGFAAAATDEQQIRLSSFYKFGPAKVGLVVDRAERTTVAGGVQGADADRMAYSIPVSFAMGNGTFLANVAYADDVEGAAALGGGNATGAKMITVGYDHALSKRTNVGLYYSRLDNEANAAYQPFLSGTSFTGSSLLRGETAQTVALGVRHSF